MHPLSTIDPSEITKFSNMAEVWWDEEGICKPLHQLNPVRIRYVQRTLRAHFRLSETASLSGIRVLDVGCGGGLLSEPLARSGMDVTGIDASEKNTNIASIHAQQSGVVLNYRAMSAEALLAEGGALYDVVLAMEVIEHVADVPLFCQTIAALVKPGGLLYVSTLNRTIKSFAYAIVGAEYILRWLPRGTHEWQKFLKPSDICPLLQKSGMSIEAIEGVSYRPLLKKYVLSDDIAVNYMVRASRQAQA